MSAIQTATTDPRIAAALRFCGHQAVEVKSSRLPNKAVWLFEGPAAEADFQKLRRLVELAYRERDRIVEEYSAVHADRGPGVFRNGVRIDRAAQ